MKIFTNNWWTDIGIRAVAESRMLCKLLQTNTTLTKLLLKGEEGRIDIETVKALIEALTINTSLSSFGLNCELLMADNNHLWFIAGVKKWEDATLGDEGAKTFCEALRTNSRLTSLELMWKNFFAWLALMRKKRVFKSTANRIGIEGAKCLCELLRTNSSLTSLDLHGGVSFVVSHNARNERSTWYTGNRIGNEGASFFSQMLRTNSTLTGLQIGGDEWTRTSIQFWVFTAWWAWIQQRTILDPRERQNCSKHWRSIPPLLICICKVNSEWTCKE